MDIIEDNIFGTISEFN